MSSKILGRWLLLIGVGIIVLVGLLITQGVGAGSVAGIPKQKDIEAKAVVAAQNGLMYARLQGQPTSVTSKQMKLGEFQARLDPFSQDPRDKVTTVWVVLINGNVQVGGPPAADGSNVVTSYDNMWLLMSVTGDVISWGSQAPGYALDLSQPPVPLSSWPTPVGPQPKEP